MRPYRPRPRPPPPPAALTGGGALLAGLMAFVDSVEKSMASMVTSTRYRR